MANSLNSLAIMISNDSNHGATEQFYSSSNFGAAELLAMLGNSSSSQSKSRNAFVSQIGRRFRKQLAHQKVSGYLAHQKVSADL